MATGLPRATKEDFVAFRDVVVDFTPEEWRLLSPAQRTLHREITLETYNHLISLEILLVKSKLINNMEQEEEPWREERKHSLEGGPVSKTSANICGQVLCLSSSQIYAQDLTTFHGNII
ncbi:zinc finger protein 875-like [Thomomys bottae]